MPSPSEPLSAAIFTGRCASHGVACGPVWSPAAKSHRRPGALQGGSRDLSAAVAEARRQLAALANRSGGDAAALIEFQDAMLEDPAWLEAAVGLVESGMDAAKAWRAVLDVEAASYEAASDPAFAARAADIRDLRDRVLACLHGEASADPIPDGAIYLSNDIALSRFLGHDWTGGGVALRAGSELGHVAVLARQRGIPMLVGLQGEPAASLDGTDVVLDATAGRLIVGQAPGQALRRANGQGHGEGDGHLRGRGPAAVPFATTRDGTRITLQVSISRMEDVAGLAASATSGIGLVRTEFSFNGRLAGEDEQGELYRSMLAWAAGAPVTIRLMDWGDDKPLPGSGQAMDMAVLRGAGLLLRHPHLFRPQVRALLRAAVLPGLRVLVPMVSDPAELEAAHALFAEEAARLAASSIAHAVPPIGIMAEVPAVLDEPERFARAAFFSIGSNDLTRAMHGGVAAVLDRLPRFLAKAARLAIPVNLCGDAAAEPALIPALLKAGLRDLTVSPLSLGDVVRAIENTELGDSRPWPVEGTPT